MKTKFLFGTKKSLLGYNGKEFKEIHQGWGPYIGVSWSRERVFAVARGHPNAEVVLILDKKLVVEDMLVGDLKGTNYIHYADGKLFIANTGRERLVIVDVVTGAIRAVSLTGYDYDHNHLNSVWSDGEYTYVTEGGRTGNRMKMLDADFNVIHIEEDLGKTIHNIYRENDWIYTVSSIGESINARSLGTGEQQEFPYGQHHRGYGEGLCRIKPHWYIGVSQDSPNHSAVLQFDDGFSLVDKLLLPDDIGQLYEVRALSARDRAHNRLPFPGRL